MIFLSTFLSIAMMITPVKPGVYVPKVKEPLVEMVITETPAIINQHRNIPITNEKQDYIYTICKQNDCDTDFVKSIIYEESRCQDLDPNEWGCMGVMQVNPVTAQATLDWAKIHDVKQYNEIIQNYNLQDFYTNVHVGVLRLRMLGEQYDGDIYQMALEYGMGIGNMQTFILKNYFGKEPDYLKKWFSYQEQLQKYGTILDK